MANGWDVARAAGVSQSTVSRVLRGDTRVSPQAREAVRQAAEALDYAPDLSARALITRRSGTIAMVVPDVTNPVYPQLISAVQRELQAVGHRLLLLNARFGDTNAHVAALRGGLVDGVLLATTSLDVPLDQFLPKDLPTVLLIREAPDGGYESYLADDGMGCELAAEHLTALGHSRIAIISGPQNLLVATRRVRLFRAALRRKMVTLAKDMVCRSPLDFSSAADIATDLLRRAAPTAIFCAADVLALGAMQAILGSGRQVPVDVSVLGFDDVTMAGWDMIGLTTVRQPFDQMAKEAVRALLTQVDYGGRPSRPKAHRFPVELVVRKTTAPPPGGS
jgi:LacI family transcriptional regulator